MDGKHNETQPTYDGCPEIKPELHWGEELLPYLQPNVTKKKKNPLKISFYCESLREESLSL